MHQLMDLMQKWWQMHDDYVSCCSESAPYKTLVVRVAAAQTLICSTSVVSFCL